MHKVNSGNLQDIVKLLIELELAMGEFYETCSLRWPEDENFWKNIGGQELQHADYLQKMSDIISTGSEKFMLGRKVNPLAINTVVSGTKRNRELVTSNTLTKIKTLYVARDMENSALESRLDQIVKTDDLEFLELAGKILLQTQNHKNTLNNKIAELHTNKGI